MLRLKLKTFLEQHQLSESKLAEAIAVVFIESGQSVSARHLRYVVGNTEPMTAENQLRKPSLIMVGLVIAGLRKLTNEPVDVSDVLEYVPENPLQEALLSEPEVSETPSPATEIVLIKSSTSADTVLDSVRSLVAAHLRENGYTNLLLLLPETEGSTPTLDDPVWQTPHRKRKSWLVPLLSVLSVISLGALTYDFLVVRPQLYLLRGGVFSFRDRLKTTSTLPIPTLIGPEGEVDQFTPILRVEPIDGALGYEFYVENSISEDGVYTGPIPNNSFMVPTRVCLTD